MSRQIERIVELRLGWRLVAKDLRLDAEVVTAQRGQRAAHTVILAHGRSTWSSPRSELETEVLAWLRGEAPSDWAHDPAGLPRPELANIWGDLLAGMLATAVDKTALELAFFAPSRAPGTIGRIASMAHDEPTAALPLETLVWPPASTATVALRHGAHPLSIVRVPVRVESRRPATVQQHEPGRFRVRVATAPGPKHEYGLGDMASLVRAAASSATRVEELTVRLEMLWKVASAPVADLLVLCGHGSHEGLHVGGPGAHTPIGGDVLAREAVGGATAVMLAMCGSALGGPITQGARPQAPAEALAEHGTSIVVGFHGAEANLALVRAFTSKLVQEIGSLLESDDRHRELDLVDWELAIGEARGPLPTPTAPAVWVAPALLAGRSPGQLIARIFPSDATVTATAFYVPGQIACTHVGSSAVRFPLVVDVGVDVVVRLAEGVETSAGNTALPVAMVRECGKEFGLPATHGVELWRTTLPPDGWAPCSSEYSALVRGLCALLGCPVPDAARHRLDTLVAREWGAHDAAPRVVDVGSGRRSGVFDDWPPMMVGLVKDHPPMPQHLCDAVTGDPPTFDTDVLRRPGAIDLEVVQRLVRQQADAVRTWRDTQPTGTSAIKVALRRGGSTVVVVPDAATIQPGSGAMPRLEGCSPRNVDVPAILPD